MLHHNDSQGTVAIGSQRTAMAMIVLCAMSVAMPVLAGGGDLDDRVLWRFELATETAGQFITAIDDGTIYVTDNTALYALSSDGELLWSLPGAGGGRPIPVADDGTIYTGNNDIKAINPDGTLKWQFTPPTSQPLLAGPSIGPNGNIYAVQDRILSTQEGLGAFSVDPDGDLRWSNIGDPEIFNTSGGTNSEIVFGEEAMFVGLVGASGPPSTRAFDMSDGEQLWCSCNLDHSANSMPRLLPDVRLVFNLGQTGLNALNQDGSESWSEFHPGPGTISALTTPAVGPDGMIYTADAFGLQLWKVTSDGDTVFVGENTSDFVTNVAISPDSESLLIAGGGSFGEPGWVRRYDPADGSFQWNVDLPNESGMLQFVTSIRPEFTADGSTAYFTTTFAGSTVGHSYLYALDLTDAGEDTPGDVNDDGVVNVDDLLMILNNWGTCADCNVCLADITGNCTVNVDDLLVVLNNWG